jgi:hypothetical protein
MTFPLARPATLHPSMPRRPERAKGETRPGIRVYFEREIRPGVIQMISTTTDSLHVRRIRKDGGQRIVGLRFEVDELPVVERAINLSKTTSYLSAAGRIRRADGTEVQIGASSGVVHMRLILSNGKQRGTKIQGEELAALAFALAEFKQSVRTE